LITPTSASNNATSGLVSRTKSTTEAGKGELNNAASWDDFPNGRFGDFKSPAFGNQDPWGGSGMMVCIILCLRFVKSLLLTAISSIATFTLNGVSQELLMI
jgi:hypothetical protein